ncbi:MAG: hypothetical protein M1837_005568 [Sclerophora amabilis]|nr:MAG: hypothetical protein M1837_005568 [Sclerophora amabilis]
MAPHASKRRKIDVSTNETGAFSEDRFSDGYGESIGIENVPQRNLHGDASYEVESRASRAENATQRKMRLDTGASQAFLGGASRSSMFKLQVDELLTEIRPDYERRRTSIEKTLRRLKSVIEELPDREGTSISEAERDLQKIHKIVIPFPEPRPAKDARYRMAYSKPGNINVVGSYALRTATKDNGIMSVDMAVTMPSTIFQEKDYLNYRYFHKRAYYLACLAAGIKANEGSNYDISFKCLNDNPLQPIIYLRPLNNKKADGVSGSRYEVNVIPVVNEATFLKSRTLPCVNSVRRKGLNLDETASTDTADPTPFYNGSLRSDCAATPYLKVLHAASAECSSFRDACLLGRIWLRQRGFGSGVSKGGFGHFEWAAMTAILLHGGNAQGKNVLSTGYSSYQLFKATMNYLSIRNLESDPLLYQTQETVISKSEGPVFFDGPRGLNILFKMSSWSYRKLRHEARTSVHMLNDTVFDHFEDTFILKTDSPLQKYDGYIRLPISIVASLPVTLSLDYKPVVSHFCQRIHHILSRGLGDRVKQIAISWPQSLEWSLKKLPPTNPTDGYLLIGFIFNPDSIFRAVDHGPAAEEKTAAANFRKFWGDKAELRRFKDGSIVESLIWSQKDTRESVFQQISTYLIDRHFGKEIGESAVFVGEIFNDLIPAGSMTSTPNLAAFQPLMNTFDELEKTVRGFEDLPLQLRQISAASPVLSYTSIQLPKLDHPGRHTMDPADIIVSFEGSGRWPEDLAAIQRTKIAVLLKMGDLLEESIDGLTTRLGLENGMSDLHNAAFLDVIYSNGAAFRLRIRADREQYLLETRLKRKDLTAYNREEAVIALTSYKRNFLHVTSHTQALRTQCTRFPLLSPSIRLIKKWFDAHLLCSHISDELIELFVVRVFVQPFPYSPPSSVMIGFLRTLTMLSRWDWRNEPLVIDFNGEMTTTELHSINVKFEAWRKLDPGMSRVVLFVASNLDSDGVAWTQHARPSKVVASRMTALARSACAVVRETGLDIDPKVLFTSSTTDYDFIIHLHPRFMDDRRGKGSSRPAAEFKNLQMQSDSNDEIGLVGYDPVTLFLDELKSIYSSNIIFFHHKATVSRGARGSGSGGGSGGGATHIAGLWNPHSTNLRPWKVNLTHSTRPVIGDTGTAVSGPENQDGPDNDGKGVDGLSLATKEPYLELNKPAILNEIARLGGDMIVRIEVN